MAPLRVVYPRRPWLLAALAALLFGLSLLGLEQHDDAWLLKVGGRSLDVRGATWAAWQDATRDCSQVQRVDLTLAVPSVLNPSLATPIGGLVAQAQAQAQAADVAEAVALVAAVDALRRVSPPASQSARVRRLDHWPASAGERSRQNAAEPQPGWFILQAEFDQLEPAVVLVRQVGLQAEVLSSGVWSGTTLPWNPAWRIRRFLADRVPQAPALLLACLDPLGAFAQPPKPW